MAKGIVRKGWIFLDNGVDSSVYRINDHVAKVYCRSDMTRDMLEKYYHDTQKASRLIKEEGISRSIGTAFNRYKMTVSILEQGNIYEALDGNNKVLIGVGQRYIDAHTTWQLDELCQDIYTRQKPRHSLEISDAIDSLSEAVSKLIREEIGIDFRILHINLKLALDKNRRMLDMIITDLAPSIVRSYGWN